MTREETIKELERHKKEFANDHGWANSVLDALHSPNPAAARD